MTPFAVFVRTLLKTTAIFIGVTAVFLNPSLDWSASSKSSRTSVTAQRSPREAAIVALIAALKDQDAGVRRQAATALGELRSRSALTALEGALKDGDEHVRRRAAAAIAKIAAE